MCKKNFVTKRGYMLKHWLGDHSSRLIFESN
jgi:hypothetical protein